MILSNTPIGIKIAADIDGNVFLKFLYDKNKINGEAIINHLTSIADEHDQTAAEARKEALTLIDQVRKLNHYLKKAEAIQKEIQKNTIIRRETFDFFQYKRY